MLITVPETKYVPKIPEETLRDPEEARYLTGEKKRQVEFERVHTLQLMLEKEQRFVECLRSELAKSNDVKKQEQLVGAERRVQTLQQQLLNLSSHYEQERYRPLSESLPYLHGPRRRIVGIS
ncbi:Rho guanyl-nucleotide exchange factor activity protein [Homalodisca vitripennis]|nr:Rho guanyl-nucleotide exchange factor activity protein [Homalodisca vitripennis]